MCNRSETLFYFYHFFPLFSEKEIKCYDSVYQNVQNIVKKSTQPEGVSTWRSKENFSLNKIPEGCTSFPCRQIEQAYLNTDPVVRVRRDNDDYYLTYKGKGLLSREEYNLPLNKEAYEHLLAKADGIILTKRDI